MKKKIFLLPFFLMLVLIFSGCGSRTVEEMYKLPRRSEEYQNLQSVIDSAMIGREYSSPISGENQQTVQMVDLTGDGREECLVFAKSNSEKPLQILVFTQAENDQYALLEVIELNGISFDRVEYIPFDDKPGNELVVGRRLNNQIMRIASVFSFATRDSEQIMSTIYARFITCDLNENGVSELLVIRQGDVEITDAIAVLYNYQNGGLERSREMVLSDSVEHIKRIDIGKTQDNRSAVFISSALNGDSIVTDIFLLDNGEFCNLNEYGTYGNKVQTLSNYYVYATDIDRDGAMELPELIRVKPISEDADPEEHYFIRWYSVSSSGLEYSKMYTFHDFIGGWYLELDSNWAERSTVRQEGGVYSFYLWDPTFTETAPVFTLFALTGKDRDSQADEQNRFALFRRQDVVYAAKLEPASAIYGITEEYLINGFHLIYKDWKPGET